MPSKPEEATGLYGLQRQGVETPETVDIDVSPWYGKGAVLTLRRPKLADKWHSMKGRLKVIKGRKPEWPDELCAIVASLASCHVGPNAGKDGPMPFYIALADHPDDSCFTHVQNAFTEAFTGPAPEEPGQEDAAALLRYCCLEYLHRHPEEVGELSDGAYEDLVAHHREKMQEKIALMKRLGPLAALIGLGK